MQQTKIFGIPYIGWAYAQYLGGNPEQFSSAFGICCMDSEQPVMRLLLCGSMAGMVDGPGILGSQALRDIPGLSCDSDMGMDVLE